MIATDQNSLITAASALQKITGPTKDLVMIALLQQIAGGAYASMTQDQLITLANPLQKITGPTAKLVIIALLSEIVNEV